MGRHNVHPGNWQISGIAKRGGGKLSHYCIVLVLTEHEYMGPSLTHAEGFILGVGAKMFTIAGPSKKPPDGGFFDMCHAVFFSSIRSKLWIQSAFRK